MPGPYGVFFSAEAGLLKFLVLRPDAGALQPVDDDVAIFLNELEELLGKYSTNPSSKITGSAYF